MSATPTTILKFNVRELFSVYMLVQILAIGTIFLGIAYVVVPRTMDECNVGVLRDPGTELPDMAVWWYRVLGIGLVSIGLSHLP